MSDIIKEANTSEYSVEVQDLTHRYETHLAVDHISFKIKRGTAFGLIGPNGAGKSTTIKMLTTLLPVKAGDALVNGFSITENPAGVRQSIGYVPQLLSADGELTGYENLLLSAKLYGLPRDERSQRIQEVLDFLELSENGHRLVRSYSGGMIRRLEIAQALLHKPAVLFLDEPSVGLDPAARKSLWRHINSLSEQMGTTIFMTTHDMEEADFLCDIVALMHLGHIVVMDTPEKLKAAIGPKATLDDVFILHTGSSLKDTGDFGNVKETRSTISNL
ncbi:MAG: ATP-binding cassette domain-containing protein [Parachlamydiales bacterium]|jgi:ABC-2 type transport system ATP-binding protein